MKAELERFLQRCCGKRRIVSLTDVNRCSYWRNSGSIFPGEAPIHIAADRNDLAGMRVLLDNGADVNLRSGCREYETALHVAARDGNHDMLQLLLEHGADCNAMDSRYHTPLHFASSGECVRALVAAGAKVDVAATDDAKTPLHDAVGWDMWDEDRPQDVSDWDKHVAGIVERITALLESGANVNAIANVYGTPLHHFLDSARWGYLTIWRPGNKAFIKHFMSVLSLLLQHGANVNAREAGIGRTPLHIAAEKGLSMAVMDKLLEHGGCANASDSHGCTPLYKAV